MQKVLVTSEDLRFALQHVRDRDVTFAAVLTGMLNNWLQHSPIQLEHRSRNNDLGYTYNIARFDIAEERLDEFTRRAPHIQLVPVIDEPTLHFETHPVGPRYVTGQYGIAMTLTNLGYKAPPPAEPQAGEAQTRPAGGLGYGAWEDIRFGDADFAVLVQHQITLMEAWGAVFKGAIKTTKHISPGQLVVWGEETQSQRFPNIPMFQVVAQVQPFIHNDSLVDTIIQPQGTGRGFGPSKEVYAHSTDLLSLEEYQVLLLRGPNLHSSFGGDGIKPSDFIIEALNGIPEALLKRY